MRQPINGSPGLWTAPNSELAPRGALKQAQGCVIKRPGVIEKRRPLEQIAISADTNNALTTICEYNARLYAANTTNNSIFVSNDLAASAAWTTVAFSTARLEFERSFEMNRVLYDGAYKIDADAGTPYFMGVPRAPDVQLTLVATGTLLANTNSVAYRAVYGLLDAKSNLILGPPSGRATVTGTAAQNVTVKSSIPTNIVNAANGTSYSVQVYRTSVNVTASTDPGEEMQLVYMATLTSTDISNKFVSFTDATPDGLRGAQGYFCPSQEGLALANYQPPQAGYTAIFKSQAFYGNTTGKHRLRTQLLGIGKNLLVVSTGAGGITKSGGNGVYTFTGSPDLTGIPTDGTAKLSSTGNTSAGNNGEFVITAVNTGAFTITVTNAGAVTEVGTANSRAWPSKITLNAVNYYGSINGTETVASQIFKVATAGTDSQNVVDSCASFLRVVNQQTSPTIVGYYESGPDDGAGKMMFEEVSIGSAQYTLAAAGTLLYNSFNPTCPSTATTKSQNDVAVHRVYYSKVGQPEHVPLGNYFDIGSGLKAVRGLVPLRDSLLIWKEDGLYKIISDGAGNVSVAPFDISLRLATDTLTTTGRGPVRVLQNKAYALTNKGAVAVSDVSVTTISTPVALLRWLTDDPVASQLQFSVVASERDAVVHFGISGLKLRGNYCFMYCVTTGAWTEYDIGLLTASGQSSTTTSFGAMRGFEGSNGRIYRWYRNAGNVFREASAGLADYTTWKTDVAGAPLQSDRFLINVTSVNVGASTASVTVYTNGYGSTNGGLPAVDLTGCALLGTDNAIWKVTADSNPTGTSKTLTMALLIDILVGDGPASLSALPARCTMFVPIAAIIEWQPFTAGDDSVPNRSTETVIVLDTIGTVTTTAINAHTEAVADTQIASFTSSNSPLPAGATGLTALRTTIPLNMQQSRRLSITLTHSAVCEYLFIRGIAFAFEEQAGRSVT